MVIAAADIADTVAGHHGALDNAPLYPMLAVAWAPFFAPALRRSAAVSTVVM